MKISDNGSRKYKSRNIQNLCDIQTDGKNRTEQLIKVFITYKSNQRGK